MMSAVCQSDLPPNNFPPSPLFPQVGPLDMQGAIRPGCVHLGIDFTMPSVDQRDSTAEAFMRNLLTAVSANNDMPWCNFDTDIFLPDSIIKVTTAALPCPSCCPSSVYPSLLSLTIRSSRCVIDFCCFGFF